MAEKLCTLRKRGGSNSSSDVIYPLQDAVFIEKQTGTSWAFTLPNEDGYYIVCRSNGTIPTNNSGTNNLCEHIAYIENNNCYSFGARTSSFNSVTRVLSGGGYGGSVDFSLFRIAKL